MATTAKDYALEIVASFPPLNSEQQDALRLLFSVTSSSARGGDGA